MKLSKKLIENMDVEITKLDGKVYFTFLMDEVKYNKLMSTRIKPVKKVKQPTNRELLLKLVNDVEVIKEDIQLMKNTPTMKKELGLK